MKFFAPISDPGGLQIWLKELRDDGTYRTITLSVEEGRLLPHPLPIRTALLDPRRVNVFIDPAKEVGDV